LLLIVLERAIFTLLLYSKDIMLYSDLECGGLPSLFSQPQSPKKGTRDRIGEWRTLRFFRVRFFADFVVNH